jgi:hypothetical protein
MLISWITLFIFVSSRLYINVNWYYQHSCVRKNLVLAKLRYITSIGKYTINFAPDYANDVVIEIDIKPKFKLLQLPGN